MSINEAFTLLNFVINITTLVKKIIIKKTMIFPEEKNFFDLKR